MLRKKAESDPLKPFMVFGVVVVWAVILWGMDDAIAEVISGVLTNIAGNSFFLTEWLLVAFVPLMWIISVVCWGWMFKRAMGGADE